MGDNDKTNLLKSYSNELLDGMPDFIQELSVRGIGANFIEYVQQYDGSGLFIDYVVKSPEPVSGLIETILLETCEELSQELSEKSPKNTAPHTMQIGALVADQEYEQIIEHYQSFFEQINELEAKQRKSEKEFVDANLPIPDELIQARQKIDSLKAKQEEILSEATDWVSVYQSIDETLGADFRGILASGLSGSKSYQKKFAKDWLLSLFFDEKSNLFLLHLKEMELIYRHNKSRNVEGVKTRHSKWQPLKSLAIELYEQRIFVSTKAASKQIAPKVKLRAQELKINVTVDSENFEQTVYRWLLQHVKSKPKNAST